MTRNTAIRDRHRKVIARGKPPCALCGDAIDYALVYPNSGAFVVDHVIPVAIGGADTLENKQPAHAHCNWVKYTKTNEPAPQAPRTFVTSRTW